MRWVYLLFVNLFVATVVVFAVQNLQLTTMSFLGFSLRARLFALLHAIIQATNASWPATSQT
jgi:hypothetical protein